MAHDAILLWEGNCCDPCGKVSRHVLLEDLLAVNAVRIPFHDNGPSAQMRQHRRGDFLVVLDELPLGDPIIGKEHLVGMCDFNDLSTNANSFTPRARAHTGRSRTTSRGSLSRRTPRKRGCRKRPSRVHCVKLTCATSFGLTQCTPLPAFTSSENGE